MNFFVTCCDLILLLRQFVDAITTRVRNNNSLQKLINEVGRTFFTTINFYLKQNFNLEEILKDHGFLKFSIF